MGLQVPTEGNSWFIVNSGGANEQDHNPGDSWTNLQHLHRTFFRISRGGEIHIGIKAKVEKAPSVIKATFLNQIAEVEISSLKYTDYYIGTYDYAGGIINTQAVFYLKNCGFFNQTTSIDTWFFRMQLGQQPDIEFDALP